MGYAEEPVQPQRSNIVKKMFYKDEKPAPSTGPSAHSQAES